MLVVDTFHGKQGSKNSVKNVSFVYNSHYKTTNATERTRLGKIVQLLRNAGLSCEEVGRDFIAKAREADLIVIDLFLGPLESHDLDPDIKRVRELVINRVRNPPLIILTSSSRRLYEKRKDFRDKAGLLASTFRVASKSELIEDGRLKSILSRLASHYDDAKRIAGFLDAWDQSLKHMRESFLKHLRRLDLSDLAQIRTLLLNSEGERLGDYLLDVADRVLQHEIEGDSRTLRATLELNKIDLLKYPTPHLTGTSGLQDLVHRMTFMHEARLDLFEDDGIPRLQFGDVLRRKKKGEEDYGDEVCLVVTPACDLVRNRIDHILLLSGKLKDLTPENWSDKDSLAKTSIIILPDNQRKWIKWNFKAVKTQQENALNKSFLSGCLIRIARLRESYALTLQQKLLARIGRIGQPANLPASFPVAVSLFYVGTDKKAQNLGVEGIESAACYVGRKDGSESVHHLVLTERTCDQIGQALRELSKKNVCQQARESLRAARDDPEFITRFEQGEIEMPHKKGTKPIEFKGNKNCAAIVRNDNKFEHGVDITGNTKKAAIIVKVTDVLDESSNQDTV